jgi:hypothetical protein
MAKAIVIEKRQLIKKLGIEIGIKYLAKRKAKMPGTEVKIKLKENNKTLISKGYILKKIYDHLFEIWSEEENTILTLSPDQFEQIED